jgi:predicted RNA-binding protein with PIN domain
VPWYEVEDYKHISYEPKRLSADSALPSMARLGKKYNVSHEELEAIMLKEFGPISRRVYGEPKRNAAPSSEKHKKPKSSAPRKRTVIIDGYNLIYAWEELKELADFSLEKARETLMDILANYVGYTKTEVILVFDAYLVKVGDCRDFEKDGFRVVFTKQEQTADAFIERLMFELGPNYDIKVVTGDQLIQFSAVRSGILRMTAKEFTDELITVGNEITSFIRKLAEEKV